jgi:hypothetical protein
MRATVQTTPKPVNTPLPTVGEADAALYCGLSRSFLRKARRFGCGPAYIRLGLSSSTRRSIRYQVADLQAWLDGQRVSHPASA